MKKSLLISVFATLAMMISLNAFAQEKATGKAYKAIQKDEKVINKDLQKKAIKESRHRGVAVHPRCGGGRPCDAGGGQRLQTIRRIPFRPSRRWWSLPTLRTRNGTKLQSRLF